MARGKTNKKISGRGKKFSRGQIIGYMRITRFCERYYDTFLLGVLGLYKTEPEMKRKWSRYSSAKKREHLKEHLADLEGRRIEDIAQRIIMESDEYKGAFSGVTPGYEKLFAKNIVENLLRIAVKRRDLHRETHDNERSYRASISGRVGAEACREKRVGAFYWDDEKRERYREAIASRFDYSLYFKPEEETLLALCNDPCHQHRNGHPNWAEVTTEMNTRFRNERPDRTVNACRNHYYSLKKQSEKEAAA